MCNNKQHHRRSIRLQGYNYAQAGAYFVTICTHERRHLFGNVVDGDMRVNDWGVFVRSCWDEIPSHHPYIELDAFVVMPNHMHGVIVITGDNGVMVDTPGDDRKGMIYHAPTDVKREFSKPITHSLSSIVGTFKAAVTRHIKRQPNAPDHPIWQRNYHEHIIRNESSLDTIRAYVANNAAKWVEDSLYTL